MNTESEVVTAPATTNDTIESISVHEEQPNNGSEPVVDKKPETTPKEGEESPKTLNPRTQQRKAEKERLIRENAAKDEQLKQVQAELAKYKQPETPTERKLDLSKEPDIKNYTDALEYARDLAKYDNHQMLVERDKKAAEATRAQHIEAYQEQADIIRATMPDFDDKVDALYNAGLIQPGSVLENAIISSADNAKLAEHFVKFPADLQALNMYKPEAIPAALKQIRTWIKTQGAQPVQQPLRQTQAKPPIKPVGQSASVSKDVNDLTQEELENMPQAEFEAKYMRK